MIKFRGIPLEDTSDIDGVDFDGTFVYGNYVKYGDGAIIVGDALEVGEDRFFPSWWVPVDPKTVGQFTGLKDVNSKKIYIGDIVKKWPNIGELTMVPTINEIVSEDHFGRPGVFLKPVGAHVIERCLYDNWSNAKMEDVAVKSNCPIDIEWVNEMVEQHAYSCTKQVVTEGQLADENLEGGDTKFEVIGNVHENAELLEEDK
ncbi:prophage P2a protein 26 [Lactiplantibacillus plantarum]|nr:prophage P2a protein 26 [Lactiplantibacillus plantarum]